MAAHEETICETCLATYIYRPGYEHSDSCPACLYRGTSKVIQLEEELESCHQDFCYVQEQLSEAEGELEELRAKVPTCFHCGVEAVCVRADNKTYFHAAVPLRPPLLASTRKRPELVRVASDDVRDA